jgi:hypothetical protein
MVRLVRVKAMFRCFGYNLIALMNLKKQGEDGGGYLKLVKKERNKRFSEESTNSVAGSDQESGFCIVFSGSR